MAFPCSKKYEKTEKRAKQKLPNSISGRYIFVFLILLRKYSLYFFALLTLLISSLRYNFLETLQLIYIITRSRGTDLLKAIKFIVISNVFQQNVIKIDSFLRIFLLNL